MLEQDQRRLSARLHRIEGQIRGLDTQLKSQSDPLLVIAQFDAVVAAAKGALINYIELTLPHLTKEKQEKIIRRVIRKS